MRWKSTSRGSAATGAAGVSLLIFSVALDAFWGLSTWDWLLLLLSLKLNPLLWLSRKSCEVVSRANLVTRENFSSTWIERAGSWTFCFCLPLNWVTLKLPSWTSLFELSCFPFEEDSPIYDSDGSLAIDTTLGSSKDDSVFCRSQ